MKNKRNRKDRLYKMVSKMGVVTLRDYDSTIIDRVVENSADGFKFYIECADCSNIHLIGTDCQCCDKKYLGFY